MKTLSEVNTITKGDEMKKLIIGQHDEEIEQNTMEDVSLYQKGDAFLIDNDGLWCVEFVSPWWGMHFWAMAGNDDRMFPDAESAFAWVKKTLV